MGGLLYICNNKTTTMKDIIITALNSVYNKAIELAPNTKLVYKSVTITDVKPIELINFMQENNIPDTAEFDFETAEEHYGENNILLCWKVEISTTEDDKNSFVKKYVNRLAGFKAVYELLIANGYKRVSVNSAEFKNFRDTTPYDMYMEKDFDRLVEYYSLYFKED